MLLGLIKYIKTNRFTIFIGILLVVALLITILSFYNNVEEKNNVSEALILNTSDLVSVHIENYFAPTDDYNKVINQLYRENEDLFTDNDALGRFAMNLLDLYPQMNSFIVGDETGNFFMIKKEADTSMSTWIIDRESHITNETWIYRDSDGNIQNRVYSTEVRYDPRIRPWYIGSKENDGYYWTNVYIFFSDKAPGITVGYDIKKNNEFWGVYGFDIKLEALSRFIKNLNLTDNSKVFIINEKEELLAYEDIDAILNRNGDELTLKKISDFVGFGLSESYNNFKAMGMKEEIFRFDSDKKEYLAFYNDLSHIIGKQWYVGIVVPENDFVAGLKLSNTFILSNIGLLLMLMILLVYYRRKHNKSQKALVAIANKDQLTGVLNRHSFNKIFKYFVDSSSSSSNFSIIMGDLDYFKKVNDTYGHNMGDIVLKEVANILVDHLRTEDIICRWGGEEFLLLLPTANLEQATHVAEKLRSKVLQHNFRYKDTYFNLTISFGVAEYSSDLNLRDFIQVADSRLYHAKQTGRNKVVNKIDKNVIDGNFLRG